MLSSLLKEKKGHKSLLCWLVTTKLNRNSNWKYEAELYWLNFTTLYLLMFAFIGVVILVNIKSLITKNKKVFFHINHWALSLLNHCNRTVTLQVLNNYKTRHSLFKYPLRMLDIKLLMSNISSVWSINILTSGLQT